ncbi:sacsin N-terminal ATP-binding-like domain-containing protein [Pseudocolwellia sp. HL-MZ19]|uniref:sacsin N-terminal ATP-binding-like domain-containing protein n=1 Tax=Pseudocolwellia sp. HL-MZ19 TaxID=3400846 RepID=UPI003CFB0FEF
MVGVSRKSSYRPPVTKLLQSMIEKYNAKSLLKEFLQNADDAGATELVVTLDLRSHGEFQLPEFNVASGPSLIVSNNALFSDEDFKAIEEIMDGNKVLKPRSTGRFGQGFTSSFSISDHPSFISGGLRKGRSMWFDVHESAVCKELGEAIAIWDHEEFYPEIKQWLNTFLLPQEESIDDRTVFRLPLRTPLTAESSLISNQIFDEVHFYGWCDEWKDQAENLLFLRNVHTLVLRKVDEQGCVQDLLKIETKNNEKISEQKNIVNSALLYEKTPKEICEDWLSNDAELPVVKYKHIFQSEYLNRETMIVESTTSMWAVINGLFRGDDDILLDHANKVLSLGPNYRKVLPWAGVAIPLDESGLATFQTGRFFTFLPLDIETHNKAHLHGWFELDDKRTSITLKSGNDDDVLLVKWNLLLLEYAIGRAWAELILHYKDEFSPQDYYKLWPSVGKDHFEKRLSKGFYQRMASADCMRIWYEDQEYWSRPSKDKYFCMKRGSVDVPSQALKKLAQKRIELITPEPPQRVIDSLKEHGSEVSLFTPEVLIDLISSSISHIDFPLAEAQIEDLFFLRTTNYFTCTELYS